MAAVFCDEAINSHEVVLFSKSSCPFCVKAKKALDSIGVKYHTVEIANRKGNNAKAPRRYIFINCFRYE